MLQDTAGSIIVADDCLFARQIALRTFDSHAIIDLKSRERTNDPKPITIERHVWVGNQAIVNRGVRIGRGSIIGARAYINKNIPECCIAAGIPGRIIKMNVSWTMDGSPSEADIDALMRMLGQ